MRRNNLPYKIVCILFLSVTTMSVNSQNKAITFMKLEHCQLISDMK